MNKRNIDESAQADELNTDRSLEADSVNKFRHPKAEIEAAGDGELAPFVARMALAKWHPGMLFFQHLADSFYSVSLPPDARFRKMHAEHKCLYRTLVGLDLVVLFGVVLGILFGMGVIGLRVLWPELLPALVERVSTAN